ncbi:MAG: hypothetical protein OEY91_12325 [Nitrospirota bacterium]|nr:hypothetical protein [Nitrospirota bacterium]
MTNTIQREHIESTIQNLPIQNRTMIQLLLLQYFDMTQEEIDYMATDQPDSRFLSGNQPKGKTISLEAVQNVESRANQYKGYYRQKRERPGMHVEFLKQTLAIMDRKVRVAEGMLISNFNADEEMLNAAKSQAPSILLRQELRKLDRAWEAEELPQADYQRQRLLLEYQGLLRRRAILRRRYKLAQQDLLSAGNLPLKDHEIAHVWGIPLGSLAARKVKALQQFLTLLQQHQNQEAPANSPSQPLDLWRETLTVLSQGPIQRSLVDYDGLEKTEERLMDKLEAFINGTMSEPEESKFWSSITKVNDTEFSGSWASHARSILAFQRMHALLNDMDLSDEALEDELSAKIMPKLPDDQLATEEEEKPVELGEQGLGVLNSFIGEQDDKRRG